MIEKADKKFNKDRVIRIVGHNTLYGYAAMGWTVFLGFWVTPQILRAIGNELYGIWGIALSTFGVVTFFDLGLGSALVLYVAQYRVREKAEEVHQAIHSAQTLYALFGLLGGLLLFGGGRLMVTHLLKVSPEFQDLTCSILAIYGILFAIQMPAKVYEDVLVGMQRLDISTKIGLCVRTVERLLVLFLLIKKVNFLSVVWVSGGLGLLIYPIEFMMVKRLLPGYRLRFALRKKDIRNLFVTGGQQFVASLGGIFVGTTDRFLLGTLLHVRMVTFYDLASRPSQFLYQLSLRFFLPIYPVSAELQALQEKERIKTLFKKGTKVLFVLLTPLALAVFLWSFEIIRFWVGPEYALSGQMLQILTLSYFIHSLNVIPAAMMYGLNKAWIISSESFTRLSLNFLFSFFLIRKIGAVGAAYGLALANGVTVPFFFWFMAKRVNIGGRELLSEVLLFPLLLCFLGSLFFLLGRLVSFPLGISFAIFVLFFGWSSIVFYIGKDEFFSLVGAVFLKGR